MRTCTRCIMNDSADPTITFDENGYCNYCTDALAKINTTAYFPNEEGGKRLHALLEQVKKSGEGKPYDCIMGISGGLDSAPISAAHGGFGSWRCMWTTGTIRTSPRRTCVSS